METTWKKINTQDLKEGMFIIIKYWYWDGGIHNSLAKVIKEEKTNFLIQEIGISKREMKKNEILDRFPTLGTIKNRKIKKDENCIAPSIEILDIFIIEPAIINAIAENMIRENDVQIKELEEKIIPFEQNRKEIDRIIKNLGLNMNPLD